MIPRYDLHDPLHRDGARRAPPSGVSDTSMQGLGVLQGEPIDGVWEAQSMVDEAGRRYDAAYAYLRPVMGSNGVPLLLCPLM
jgi:hypothetical protein